MTTRHIACALLLAAATFTACSKDDNNDTTPPSNEVTLVAKWNQVSEKHIERNTLKEYVVYFGPGDYWEFTKDSIFANVRGISTRLRYKKLADDSTLLYYLSASSIPTDTFFIRTLTSNALVLRGRADQANNIGILTFKR